MRKILLSAIVLMFISNSCQAGIITFGRNHDYYSPHNAVRYNRNYYPSNYYNKRYVNPYYRNNYYNQYPNNYYYNQPPIIYRTIFRKSSEQNCEQNVSNNILGISKLEKQVFQETFEGDSPQVRIERLEQKIFGAVQNGDLQERFYVLQSAVKTYKTFNQSPQYAQNYSYRPPVFTGSSGSSWRNTLWGNIKNQFAGMPTGFTPAMDPAYMDWFEAERAMMGDGESVDYRTNHGFYRSNVNRGSGVGVTILD